MLVKSVDIQLTQLSNCLRSILIPLIISLRMIVIVVLLMHLFPSRAFSSLPALPVNTCFLLSFRLYKAPHFIVKLTNSSVIWCGDQRLFRVLEGALEQLEFERVFFVQGKHALSNSIISLTVIRLLFQDQLTLTDSFVEVSVFEMTCRQITSQRQLQLLCLRARLHFFVLHQIYCVDRGKVFAFGIIMLTSTENLICLLFKLESLFEFRVFFRHI